ncbi:MAG: sugar phosphate isomerase/epimerase family protein [Cellulosilyticaceae bacterium]
MKLYNKVYISHLISREELFGILDQYEVGIETIEFSIATVLDQGRAGVEAYVKQLAPYIGERPLSLHGPFFDLAPASFDSAIRKVTLERFEAAYEIAKQLGADRIVYHSGFIPITYYIEGWLGNSKTFWKEFMEGKGDSIKVHLENVYENEFWPLIEVIDEVNHPAFSICLDVGHVNAYSQYSLKEWIDSIGKRIGHVHLHNNNGKRDEHKGLAEGTIDIARTIVSINQFPQDVTYTLEINDVMQLKNSLEMLNL